MENRGGEKRQDGHAYAHIDPTVGEVGGQHRAESGITPGLLQAHGRQVRRSGLGVVDPRHLPPDNERSKHHANAVDEKWPAKAQEGQAGAEHWAGDIAQQECRGIGGGALTANRRWRQAHDKAHRGDSKHGRAKTCQGAQHHDVPILLGNGDQARGHGNGHQAHQVDAARADAVYQRARHGREDQPGGGEDRDHQAGGGHRDIEADHELRQKRCDKAIT